LQLFENIFKITCCGTDELDVPLRRHAGSFAFGAQLVAKSGLEATARRIEELLDDPARVIPKATLQRIKRDLAKLTLKAKIPARRVSQELLRIESVLLKCRLDLRKQILSRKVGTGGDEQTVKEEIPNRLLVVTDKLLQRLSAATPDATRKMRRPVE
jgi:hypothetical protein